MWTGKAATVDGIRMPFLEAGDPRAADVLVLVHAFPVGMRMWEQVAVPPGWRGIAPALPGFDGHDPPGGDSTLDDYARAVLTLLDHLRIDHAVVGGLSMGGYVTFALWRLARLRWRGLVLADTRTGADSDQARAGRQRLLEIATQHGTRAVADDMLPKLLGETTWRERPQVVDHARRLIERQTSEGVAAAIVRLRDRPDSTDLLTSIGVPTLIVVGDEDSVTPVSESEQMRDRLEDARLVRIARAGHLTAMENPSAFGQALAEFLDRLHPGASS